LRQTDPRPYVESTVLYFAKVSTLTELMRQLLTVFAGEACHFLFRIACSRSFSATDCKSSKFACLATFRHRIFAAITNQPQLFEISPHSATLSYTEAVTMCVPPPPKSEIKDANAFLEDQVQRLILKSKESKDGDPVLKVASLPKLYDGLTRPGTPIYVARSRLPVAIMSLAALVTTGSAIYETNLIAFACCLVCALVGYDLLSGFLHIVLDNPANLNMPVLGQPCLEFQMHHHFPTDLVQRPFLDVLGDLNTVVSIIVAWNFFLLDLSNPIVRHMAGLKIIMAYYGQFSHRSAHTPSSAKSKVLEGLRSLGLMIPLEKHRSHHRPPHDKDFCLVGVANPVIDLLYNKVTRNRHVWMIGFAALILGCIAGEAILMEKLLTSTGIV
jgi:hypothetical protein